MSDIAVESSANTKRIAGVDNLSLWVKIAVIVGMLWLLYWNILTDMAHDWWIEPAWSQGMLLPPLALYIAWIYRDRILSLPTKGDSGGLLLTGSGCLVLLIGRLASEFFLSRISFVIVLAGLVWTFWGRPRLRALAFPMLLLAAMVPLPVMLYNSLAAPLQLFASNAATQIVQNLGVTVFRDGNVIELAGISLGVAEACSGLNSLSALIVASMLLGFLFCSGTPSRLLLFAISIPMAIGVNVLRIAGTAILADHDTELAMGFYHAFSGWLVFVAGFGLLYLCAKGLHASLDNR